MAWSTNDIPDLSGKTAVITGANSGLGLESTIALAAKGANVVAAVRDVAKMEAALETIRADQPDASIEVVNLDLGDQANITAAATSIVEAHPVIDILMNNAGVMAMPERQTADGYEMQFGINHLGHWTFTALLLPSVESAPAGRVVTVTSIARFQGKPVDSANPHLRDGAYEPWRAYGQAKLANFHFGLGLADRLAAAGSRAISLVAHPGLSNTNLQKTTAAESGGSIGGEWVTRAERFGMDQAKGALSQLRAATDPAASNGGYYGPRGAINGAARGKRLFRRGSHAAAIDTLWAVSERETGVTLSIGG
ncbi:MAG: oxidoreductase [Actinomycetota bacterium]